jgi:hypothetical protein
MTAGACSRGISLPYGRLEAERDREGPETISDTQENAASDPLSPVRPYLLKFLELLKKHHQIGMEPFNT